VDKADVGTSVIRVLAAVIKRGDRYLVCRRPSHKRHGGLWEFPGGKLEYGESLFDAARRELEEELGLGVECVGETILIVHDGDSPYQIEFVQVQTIGEPRPIEHEALAWARIEELAELALAPSDRIFVDQIV
jgi:8-oxo-dGTP diphosphatase